MRSPYLPLPEGHIRLLRIYRISTGSSFSFEIRTENHALEDETQYTALSYCWGSASDNRVVTLDGHIDCPLRVRLNLWHFLCAITEQPETSDTLFWIDAVAINQADLQERSKQVQLMPQIYSRAHRVLIWLGPAAQGSDRAMQCLERVQTRDVLRVLAQLWTTAAGTAFADLCHRPYWSRLWVVQELMLGRHLELMCGDYKVAWCVMQDIYQHAAYDTPPGHLSKGRMSYMRSLESPAFVMARRLANKGRLRSLLSLILESSNLKCADNLDTVFALLGLSTSEIKVDYAVYVPVLLNAILKEHYASHTAADMTEIRVVCRALSRRVTQSDDAIFQHHHPGLPERAFCLQCVATKQYLQYIQIPVQLEPSACWIKSYNHNWVLEHLFILEGLRPEQLIMRVIESGCQNAIRLLIEPGACPGADGPSYRPQLISWAPHVNLARLTRNLLKAPQDGSEGQNPINADLDGKLYFRQVLASPLVLVKHLILRWPININSTDFSGRTTLMHAVRRGELSLVRELLQHREIDVTVQDNNGRSALIHAVIHAVITNQMHSMEALLQHGLTDINLGDSQGTTPLMYAVKTGHERVAERLLAGDGINVNVQDQHQWTALVHAIRANSHALVVKLLETPRIDLDKAADKLLLETAIDHGGIKIVEIVLNTRHHGCRKQHLSSPQLYKLAARLWPHDKLKLLRIACQEEIDAMITKDLEPEDSQGNPRSQMRQYLWPLILGKRNAHLPKDFDRVFLSDPSLRRRIQNALHDVIQVAERLRFPILELDPDHRGFSPLHYAVIASHSDEVRTILSTGSQHMNVTNRRGNTALFYALSGYNEEIASALLDDEALQITEDTVDARVWGRFHLSGSRRSSRSDRRLSGLMAEYRRIQSQEPPQPPRGADIADSDR